MAIHDRPDFQAFSALGRADSRACTLRHRKGRADEAFFLVEDAARTKLIGDVSQNLAQNLAVTDLLQRDLLSF